MNDTISFSSTYIFWPDLYGQVVKRRTYDVNALQIWSTLSTLFFVFGVAKDIIPTDCLDKEIWIEKQKIGNMISFIFLDKRNMISQYMKQDKRNMYFKICVHNCVRWQIKKIYNFLDGVYIRIYCIVYSISYFAGANRSLRKRKINLFIL